MIRLNLVKERFDITNEKIIKQIVAWQDYALCDYVFTFDSKVNSVVSKIAYSHDGELMGVAITEQYLNEATGNGQCIIQYMFVNPNHRNGLVAHEILSSILNNEDKILGTNSNPTEFSATFSKNDRASKRIFADMGFEVEETKAFGSCYAFKDLNWEKANTK